MAATHHPGLPLTGGRRAALVIGVPVCLLLLLFTAFSLVAMFGQGSYPVRYTAPAAARSLTVTSPGGPLMVHGGDGSRATVGGAASYSLVRGTVTTSSGGGAAALGYHCPMPVGNCQLNATVTAPATLPVTVRDSGGDVYVISTAGPVTVANGGGDITTSGTGGPLTLDTFGGNITTAAADSATVTATSGGGDVQLSFNRVPRAVRVDTSGGDITINLPASPAGYRVTTHTDGGNVTDSVPQDDSSPHVVTATTGGGDIVINQE